MKASSAMKTRHKQSLEKNYNEGKNIEHKLCNKGRKKSAMKAGSVMKTGHKQSLEKICNEDKKREHKLCNEGRKKSAMKAKKRTQI
ncbi:hypothetical protein ACLOJK_027771 [Asimina triloba]